MAPKTSMDTMKDQEIAMIVIRTMEALKRQEEEKDRIRGQSNQMTKCLRAVMDQQGEFDGKDVTKYLKVYWREVKLHDLKEGIVISKFATLVELEIKGIVDKLIEEVTSWEEFLRWMKEEFTLQDGDCFTQAMFLDWVNDRNNGVEPQDLNRELPKGLTNFLTLMVKQLSCKSQTIFYGWRTVGCKMTWSMLLIYWIQNMLEMWNRKALRRLYYG
jgi:hypothetical protein